MANAEQQLISRVVRTGDLSTVLDWGVTEHDFRTNECKSVWRYIAGYYSSEKTRGSVIGEKVFASVFPQLQMYDDPSMTTAALCHEVRRSRLVAEARDYIIELSENVELDPAQAIAVMNSKMQQLLALGDTKNHDVTFRDSMTRLLERYEKKKHNQFAFAKMRWPWDILNEQTGGLQEDDYVILYGRPKSMKTWVLVALLAWAFEQGKTALIYTKEMTPDNIYQRIAATICRVPYQELRNGKLMDHDEYTLMALFHELQAKYSQSNLICLDGREVGPGQDTVPWIESKIKIYKPDVVFIDGMYLLSDVNSTKRTQDHQRVMNISRDIRGMVLHTRTPVIATMQANRAASKHTDGELSEIAYSDGVGQDATIAWRVMNETATNTIANVMAGSREFKLRGFRLNGKPATDFSFHSIMTDDDIKTAEKNDDPEASKKPKKVRTPRTRGDAEATDKTDRMVDQAVGSIGAM